MTELDESGSPPLGSTGGPGRWGRWARGLVVALLIGIAAIAVIAPFVKIVRSPRGDFPRHVEFGRRLLAGEMIYREGLDIPYPPFWALVHAPLSYLPITWAQPMVFPLGVASLVLLIVILSKTESPNRLSRQGLFFVWCVTLALSARFIIRDFDECGPNLFLLALAWSAVALWRQGREYSGGVVLALAIALKCTAGIFLLYFAWKRQARMVLTASIASAAFLLAPIVVMGPANYQRDMGEWLTSLRGGVTGTSLFHGVIGEDPLLNKSLKSALTRVLVRAPEGYSGRIDSDAYWDLLDLSARQASAVILAAMLFVLGGTAFVCRGKITRSSDQVAWQCALVSLVMLLLSPLTWSQHCVATIPALFLVLRSTAERRRPSLSTGLGIATYAILVHVIHRGMFGGNVGWAVESYRPVTWAIVALAVTTALEIHRRDVANGRIHESARSPNADASEGTSRADSLPNSSAA